MATYYVSYENGNDTKGDGYAGNPYRTHIGLKAAHTLTSADEVRIEKTSGQTTSTTATCTFVEGSKTITTSADLTAEISAGDYVGKGAGSAATSSGNGNHEMLYRVNSISSGSIVLDQYYYDSTEANPTEAVTTIKIVTPFYEADRDPFDVTNGEIVTGGWTLTGTPARDSETWIRVQYTSSISAVQVDNNSTFQYMNIVDSERGVYVSDTGGTGGTLRNCSFMNSRYTGIRVYKNGVVEDCASCGLMQNGTSYGAIDLQGGTIDGCLAMHDYLALFITGANDVDLSGKTNKVRSWGTDGIRISGFTGDLDFGTFTVRGPATNGVMIATDGLKLPTINIDGCINGISSGNGATGVIIDGVDISGCTTSGIAINQCHAWTIKNSNFSGNLRDISWDFYSGGIVCINNTHTTPGEFALYPETDNSGLCTCYNCTIDAASSVKAFKYWTSTTRTNLPQLEFIDSFGYNGQIYPHASVVESTSELGDDGFPSTVMTVNTSLTKNDSDIVIRAVPVASGDERNYTFNYWTTGSWTGTVIPKLKLNGTTIATGTSITSVSSSKTSYGINTGAGTVTANGILTIELNIVSNTAPIYFGDFSVS